jgi:hypothetical protein
MTDGASIKLLDSVFSIPFLYDIYSHCDLVADQFSLGSYGTAAVGAFSCGRPVLTYIDEDRFREKGFPVPPVINCRTKEEIVSALEKVAAHPDLLKEKAGQMREWFLITHQYQAAAKKLNELLAEF